ncbi:MAG: ribonuclease P protein component [Pseudoxanthomonas sp.]
MKTTLPPASDVRARFPRSARVRAKADYARVFERARRTSHPQLTLHWLGDETPARLGLAVSRKVDRRAVVRNRIKRTLRESFRRLRPQLAGGDYVVVARAAAAGATPAQLAEAFEQTLRRAGALPAPAAGGTMPRSLNSPLPSSNKPEPHAG